MQQLRPLVSSLLKIRLESTSITHTELKGEPEVQQFTTGHVARERRGWVGNPIFCLFSLLPLFYMISLLWLPPKEENNPSGHSILQILLLESSMPGISPIG